MSRRRYGPFLCHDCGRDTDLIGNDYIVHNALWAATGLKEYGGYYLCLDDLAKRLGRPLAVEDFHPTGLAQRGPGHWGGCARMLPYVSFPRIAKHIPVLAAFRRIMARTQPAPDAADAIALFTEFWLEHHRKPPLTPELLIDLYKHIDLVAEAMP
jgi:hypothetical protein